jgi:hypothetical protein
MTQMMPELPWPMRPNPCPDCIFIARVPSRPPVSRLCDLYVCDAFHLGNFGGNLPRRKRVVAVFPDGSRIASATNYHSQEHRVRLAIRLAYEWGIWT